MALQNCKYSVLIYEEELSKEQLDNIIKYLKNGMKVYLVTKTSFSLYISQLDENRKEILNRSEKSYLFIKVDNVELQINQQGQKEYIFYDGKITDQTLYQQLKKSKFNLEQYEVEHDNLNINSLVKAGAGTGKTKVMIERILFIKHFVPNINIILKMDRYIVEWTQKTMPLKC